MHIDTWSHSNEDMYELALYSRVEDTEVCQVEPGQVDEDDEDNAAWCIVKDGVSACTGDHTETCAEWANKPKNVNKEMAESPTYIDSGYTSMFCRS